MKAINIKFFILKFLICITILNTLVIHTEADERKITITYFYITSCASCEETKELLTNLEKKGANVIYKNIAAKEIYSEFYKYLADYEVPENIKGIVPAIFIGDNYYIGKEEVIKELQKHVNGTAGFASSITKSNNTAMSTVNLSSFGVFAAGILDGINPCAISMLLLFLSIIQTYKKKYLLLIGGSFIGGTYIAYFLLGTVFFSVLSMVNVNMLRGVFRIALFLVLAICIVLNVVDLFFIHKGSYNKIILKLPLPLRKLSHELIKRYTRFEINIGLFMLTTFILGILISCTEFLCTGQIYLPTIVSIIQLSNNQLYSQEAMGLLLTYNLGFIVPLLLILAACYIGRHIYDMSELFRKNLKVIKLANILFFSFMLTYLFIS